MSYIITATIELDLEMNHGGAIEQVDARFLSRNGHTITLDVKGEFGLQNVIVKKLCNSLIDAGFVDFSIGHSY